MRHPSKGFDITLGLIKNKTEGAAPLPFGIGLCDFMKHIGDPVAKQTDSLMITLSRANFTKPF